MSEAPRRPEAPRRSRGASSRAEASAADAGSGVELGIDTASADASLALLEGERVLAERRWRVETTLARELLARLDELLAAGGVARDGLARGAVCVGPGAYTALRTGVATAQGLALALDMPLAGVSRLEADALPHLDGPLDDEGRPVVAVHDAGRGRLAWAAYAVPRAPGAPPRELVAPRPDNAAGCAATAPAGALWCGEPTEELRAALAAAGRPLGPGDEAPVEVAGGGEADGEAGRRSALGVLRLARLHDAFGDPALVDAVYLRPPPITRPREATTVAARARASRPADAGGTGDAVEE